jgi:hypothetical protein
MIIHTHNAQVAALVAPYTIERPTNSGRAFEVGAVTPVQQLDRLCTILTTDHAGQWSVSFNGDDEDRHYEYLPRYLSYPNWNAMLQICNNIGAAGKLTLWLEDVYRMPVDDTNWQRVAQLFRFWYAATHPDEYHSPPDAQPSSDAPSKRGKMSNLNIYVGSKDEREAVDSTLSAVTALLELETYKGATSASLVRWLGK